MLKLNERLALYGVWYPDDPASYPVSIVSGRIGTGGWSLLGSRWPRPRQRHLPGGRPPHRRVVESAGGGRKIRHSSTGFRLKDLFLGHQGTLGIATQATLELYLRPEAEFPAFFGYESFERPAMQPFCRSNLATLAGVILFDERWAICGATTRRTSPSRSRSSRSWPWPPTAPRARSRPPATG